MIGRSRLGGPRVLAWMLVASTSCTAAPPPAPPAPTLVVEQAAPPPAPVPLPSFDAVQPSLTYLDPEHDAQEQRRAELTTIGPLYWTLDDALAGEPRVEAQDEELPSYEARMMVVERHRAHFRLLWRRQGLRATFYLPIASFRELITERSTLLTPEGTPFANGCGVTLPAGSTPTLGARGEVVEVAYVNEWLRSRGTLPRAAIDRLYREAAPRTAGNTTAQLATPITLRDAPNGRVVAELLSDDLIPCERLGEMGGGAQKVSLVYEGVEIVGYAPRSAVSDDEVGSLGLSGSGGGRGWGMSDVTWMFLWPGDLLHPVGGREPVAWITSRRHRVIDRGAESDGSHQVQTKLGIWDLVDFRVDATTAERAARRHEAWLARVHIRNLVVAPPTHEAAIRDELQWNRRGVGLCYDHRFDDGERPHLRYAITVRYEDGAAKLELGGTAPKNTAPKNTAPKSTAPKSTAPKSDALQRFETCIQRALRFHRRPITKVTARFDLEVIPAPELDDAPASF